MAYPTIGEFPTLAPAAAGEALNRAIWEGFELWKSGGELWLEYLSALPGVRTPEALIDLNMRFMARSFDLSGYASGELLKDAGLKQPLLNDEC
jgi:hypothetical protein